MVSSSLRLIFAGIFGATAVALGAFAAHGFSGEEHQRARALLETGAKYQLIHAAVLVTLSFAQLQAKRLMAWSALMFVVGGILFPGSLYAIAFTGQGAFGAIAPIGGSAFIVGWILLIAVGLRQVKSGEKFR